MGLGVIAYALGFSFIVVRIADPAIPGWPPAHEIGLTADLITDAISDEAFSAAVNEAELAFSREHTQWVARQNN
ncbi:MAG: hypothetical protein EOQ42_11160 [Mesorhizobium sp.]|nr:hypothetical protein EJ070_01670 [Mesorhizobium sp. M1E.F.Ca.ET.045.02.1.1]RWB73069.1 MAG: hypothetical protein EOQ42_11160 [Mesorhizobium sp.]TGQ30015.1 hypothetical protein EN859_032365 [Mesorhizobium sp. M00.F.Ca.ET.216.01.1.1]TIQ17123.1 MAG: hypothetical protein E5X61_28225 [Mesorhizobium sp.]TIT12092.1 MAG: hypothetical protein E5W85_15740 [Mesorhizobium sp.]